MQAFLTQHGWGLAIFAGWLFPVTAVVAMVVHEKSAAILAAIERWLQRLSGQRRNEPLRRVAVTATAPAGPATLERRRVMPSMRPAARPTRSARRPGLAARWKDQNRHSAYL